MNTDVYYCLIAGKVAVNKLINLAVPLNRTKTKDINIIRVHLRSFVDLINNIPGCATLHPGYVNSYQVMTW